MTENLKNGMKYRVITDAANDVCDVLSFETAASDIKFTDGENGEDKSVQLGQTMQKLNTLTTDVLEIRKVSSLPSDAAAHPNTLYLVTE